MPNSKTHEQNRAKKFMTFCRNVAKSVINVIEIFQSKININFAIQHPTIKILKSCTKFFMVFTDIFLRENLISILIFNAQLQKFHESMCANFMIFCKVGSQKHSIMISFWFYVWINISKIRPFKIHVTLWPLYLKSEGVSVSGS